MWKWSLPLSYHLDEKREGTWGSLWFLYLRLFQKTRFCFLFIHDIIGTIKIYSYYVYPISGGYFCSFRDHLFSRLRRKSLMVWDKMCIEGIKWVWRKLVDNSGWPLPTSLLSLSCIFLGSVVRMYVYLVKKILSLKKKIMRML